MLNGKASVLFLIVGLTTNISLQRIIHFPEPYTRSKGKTKFELDLSKYAPKSEATGVDTANVAKRTDEFYIDQSKM